MVTQVQMIWYQYLQQAKQQSEIKNINDQKLKSFEKSLLSFLNLQKISCR